MSNSLFPFYSFLPWARRGIASQIDESDNFGTPSPGDASVRAEIKTYVHITTDGASAPIAPPVSVNLNLIGPGDVIGIHSDVVVRTEPRDWITNFEPHAFPFIEFYEEDFPWRYTPATAAASNKKLRPWLTLVVLKDDEFDRITVNGAPLSAFKINPNITPANFPFPKHDELWAWAHVSINDFLAVGNIDAKMADLNTKLTTHPDIAISRIICPRQLEENTSYNAFLIPTFETGRLAGLGIDPAGVLAQAPAWNHPSTPPATPQYDTFPIYYEWYFRTGATGDFEYLVRQVQPRVLDTRVGQRLMDIQAPGYGLTYTNGTLNTTAGTEMLEGALRVPGINAPVWPMGSQVTPETIFRDQLKDFINLGADMLNAPNGNSMYSGYYPATNGTPLTLDPVIAPPLYGRWHALRSKVDPADQNLNWLNELNLDPRYRVAASLGGDYVRNNQEKLMDLAWDQVGDVLEGNRKARLAQLALEATKALTEKHIASQPIEQLVAMTGTVHAKIKATSGVSILQDVLNSQLPESADSNAFRKIRRPTGVQMKRVDPNTLNHFNTTLVTMSQSAANSPGVGKTTPNATTFQMTSMNTAMTAVLQYPSAASVAFNISSPSGPPASPNSTVAANFQAVMTSYTNVYDASNWAPPPALPDVLAPSQFEQDIKGGISPGKTLTACFNASVNGSNLYTPPTPDVIVPAMTAPSFFIAMYKSLQELGLDYFIPNLNLIPQNSITLLESNSKFIESFLVGANYEMGRELLWREYPTDQRGTYFRHFWESKDSVKPANTSDATFEANVRDITDIYTWPSTHALGSNTGRATISNNLVLAIRGDFLKKFPTAVIYAVKAKWQQTGGVNDYTIHRIQDPNAAELYPIYSATVDPDIVFLGFDLDENIAKGVANDPNNPGYYFVIMERPGELRFGLDFALGTSVPTVNNWNDLTWNNVQTTSKNYLDLFATGSIVPIVTPQLPPPLNPPDPNISDTNWAEDAAAMAMIMYQSPVMVMIHAHEMLL